MNRKLIATMLALAGTLCWTAVAAGLLSSQIGGFAATALYLFSGAAWWVPIGRDQDVEERRNRNRD